MAATNHTTNYNLPQYIGTDKPTYLGDWNSTMGAIDTQMKTNADNASGALSAAQTAQTNANSALSTAQGADSKADTAITNAAAAQTTADNASSVATSALSTANTANSKADTNTSSISALDTRVGSVEDDILKFNLTTYKTYATNEFTVDGTGSVTFSNLTLATNSDSSIFKLYGEIHCTGFVNSVSISTTLRPDNGYTIICAGIDSNMYTRNISVATNGTISLGLGFSSDRNAYYWPCLYFNKNFGDEPAPNNN